MASFEQAIPALLEAEGGYAPADNNRGAVNFGITQKTLDSYWEKSASVCENLGLPRKVDDLTKPNATDIYQEFWWKSLRLGEINDQVLAEAMLHLSVNQGPGPAVGELQCALQDCGQAVVVDRIIGPKTRSAANAAPLPCLYEHLKLHALDRYKFLAWSEPDVYAADLPGWTARLKKLLPESLWA